MTTAITLARLRDLRLGGMAHALERQLEQGGTYEALPFLESWPCWSNRNAWSGSTANRSVRKIGTLQTARHGPGH